MLVGFYVAGVLILTLLPLSFLVARYLTKRGKGASWTIDDTLLVLSLVELRYLYQAGIRLMCDRRFPSILSSRRPLLAGSQMINERTSVDVRKLYSMAMIIST